MGYRYYFYAVPKEISKEVKGCKTVEELKIVFIKNNLSDPDYDGYLPLYRLGKEVYEFGKDIDKEFYDAVYNNDENLPLFESQELVRKYDDYGAMICTKKTFHAAIEYYHKLIKNIYSDLMRESSDNIFDNRSQFERMKGHIRDYYYRWSDEYVYPYNDDIGTTNICHSYLYEHQIFELVRCYKEFDWDKNDLLFLGW